MLLDDLRCVFGHDLAVQCAVGVDHDGGADGAEADRAAVGEEDLAHWVAAFFLFALAEAFRLEYSLELCLDLSTADGEARFSVADEDLPLDRSFDHRCQLFERSVVVDKFRFAHYIILPRLFNNRI